MTSLKNRINQAAQSVLDGKGIIRNAILAKDVVVPENPTFQDLYDGVNSIIPGAVLTLSNYPLETKNVSETVKSDDNTVIADFYQRRDGTLVYILNNKLYKYDDSLFVSTELGDIPTMTGTIRRFCTSRYTDKLFWISDTQLFVVDVETLVMTTFNVSFQIATYEQSRVNSIFSYYDEGSSILYGFPGWNLPTYSNYWCKYDITTGTLTQLATGPTYLGASGQNHISIDGNFYTFWTNLNRGDIVIRQPYKYNFQSNAWSAIATLPTFFNSSTFTAVSRYYWFTLIPDYIYFIFNAQSSGSSSLFLGNIIRYSISKNEYEFLTPYPRVVGSGWYGVGDISTNLHIMRANELECKTVFDNSKSVVIIYSNLKTIPIATKFGVYNLSAKCSDGITEFPANQDFTPVGDFIKVIDDVTLISGTIKIMTQDI